MGKLKCLSLVCALLVVSSAKAYKVVIDPWTIGQVTANTTSQGLIENQHNARVDSIDAERYRLR